MTDKRLTLVTGASQGIGRAAAVALARRGDTVIAVARSKNALESLDDEIKAQGGSTVLVPMDLKDGKGIDALGGVLAERYGRLDALIGNAGILGTLGPLQTVRPRSFEETIAVNLTANWRLIRSLDPLLRLGHHPRAVFVSSGVDLGIRGLWIALVSGAAVSATATGAHLMLPRCADGGKEPTPGVLGAVPGLQGRSRSDGRGLGR